DDAQALGELALPEWREPGRRAPLRVRRSELAAGRGHHHHATPGPAGHRHEAGREVGLVVGMRPDAEQRARVGRPAEVGASHARSWSRRRSAYGGWCRPRSRRAAPSWRRIVTIAASCLRNEFMALLPVSLRAPALRGVSGPPL